MRSINSQTKASNTSAVRFKKAVLVTAFFLAVGLIYAGFVHLTGLNVPCIFRVVTGIRCPGCGMTHALMALFRLEWEEAIRYNLLIPLFIFYTILLYIHCAYQYIKKGKYNLTCGSYVADAIFLAVVCIWGVARNFIGM